VTTLARIPADILDDRLKVRITAQMPDRPTCGSSSSFNLALLCQARATVKRGHDRFVVRRGGLGEGALDRLGGDHRVRFA
jgi:hypothetical protein